MDIITIRDFTFTYPGQKKEALSHIDMAVQEGSMCVLCGKSGCGKSTLMRQLKSALAAHGKKSGEILFDGKPLEALSHREQSSQIGFVLQNPENQIVTDKVWHELAFGLESLGCDQETIRLRVAEMASYFGIHKWFMKNVSELSGGQKQLLNLASIMAMHPRVLILDEPTSQLDPIAASDFLETVRKINRDIGTTVLITEHRLQDVIPYADQVVIMDEGTLLTQGKPEEIGRVLKGKGHGMFLSMPVPMQIYAEADSDEPCPLTVSEGRKWMTKLMTRQGKEPVYKSPDQGTPVGTAQQRKGKDAVSDVPAIDMQGIWFRYERDGQDVVRDLSLRVRQGEFYTLAGGNGAGKSTALSLLSRVRTPYRGKILLNGKDIRRYSDQELYRGCLGVLPQNPQSMFIKKTVREDLYAIIGGAKEKKSSEYPIAMKKETAVEGIVDLTGLHGLLDRHPYDLSGGEQQRLALAKVLLLRPRILLLDEPTKGLDAEYKQTLGGILKKLKAHGITILMVSHDVEFAAEYSDRVGLFFEGNVVTSKEAHAFFAGNNFYTTAANRMARHYFPEAVTGKEVVECLRKSL
ncbi:MAG TPA: cobalt ABC transporter ATP-binding protein [Lachnospiraceae bacterium]|nr:cobalt ABC transporter ATP-binding protein [Lachnospiraceae bacterium]